MDHLDGAANSYPVQMLSVGPFFSCGRMAQGHFAI